MSSGELTIKFANEEYSGTFTNGYLSYGVIKKNNIIYRGKFNKSYQLDGEYGEMIRSDRLYSGKFENGCFIVGDCYRIIDTSNLDEVTCHTKDKLHIIESGKFKNTNVHRLPILIEGKKYLNNKTEEGTFNLSEFLEYGTIHDHDGNIFTGKFSNDRLLHGEVKHDKIPFSAKISVIYDVTYEHSVYKYIHVIYSGRIEVLNKLQLLLYCCRGHNSVDMFKFYSRYLYCYNSKNIRDIISMDYTGLYPNDVLAFKQIISNLTSRCPTNYPDALT